MIAKKKTRKAAKKTTKKAARKKPAKKKAAKAKPKAKKAKPKKKAAPKKPARKPAKKSALEITGIQVIPVNQMLDDEEEMMAQFIIEYNGLLSVKGFSLVRSVQEGKGEFEGYIAPPMAVDIDGEAFEVIRFLDKEDPAESPLWNELMDKMAEAFAEKFGLSRDH
jgi:hypothetical protein